MHAIHIDATAFAPSEVVLSTTTLSFAKLFKHLRKTLVGKQSGLSGAGLGCTDAAVSHWERGLRLPRPRTIRNAVRVLADLGATADDLEKLMTAWTAAYRVKCAVQRARVAAHIKMLP